MQRYVVTPVDDSAAPAERVLGEIGGAVVVAVRTGASRGLVYVGDREITFDDDEMIVVRPA